jgi:hypothetical protein
VSNSFKVSGFSRLLLIAFTIASFALMGCALNQYHQYAYALAWHCVHGNNAEVGGRRVRIPILWWRESDPNAYDTSLLVRSYPANILNRPQIVVRPTLPGEVQDNDLQGLRTSQAIITLQNKDAFLKKQSSLVSLNPKAFTLYCVREDITPFGVAILSTLSCRAAKTHYSFTYSGSPALEKEAELILSTLE